MKPVTPHNLHKQPKKAHKRLYTLAAVLLWLGVWAFFAGYIDRELFLPAPLSVFSCFFRLAATADFWKCVGFSVGNILLGYFAGIFSGLLFAWISYVLPPAEAVISLPLKIIRAVPVASFIILALLWISSRRLSLLISFLMVLPIVYANVLSGLHSTDVGLLELARVYRMPLTKIIRRIYVPALLPHLTSALSTGAGLAWKSGIAAEVIGITKNSIGNRLYQSKIYLETTELFAWTVTIVIISLTFEKLMLLLLDRIQQKYH